MTNETIRPSSALAILNDILARDNDDLDIRMMIFDLLIDDSSTDEHSLYARPLLDDARLAIRSLDRDALTMMRLDFSLCPLHACDYAICFDDDDPDCAQIRTIHPSHDT